MRCIFLLAIFAALAIPASAQSKDKRLMKDAEYKTFLSTVDSKLPEWETALKRIDPAQSKASYADGQQIVQFRDVALQQIVYVRQCLLKERSKRSVSEKLALKGFLQGIYDMMEIVVNLEIQSRLTLSTLEKYAPELSKLLISISK